MKKGSEKGRAWLISMLNIISVNIATMASGEAHVYTHSLAELAQQIQAMKVYKYDGAEEESCAWDKCERADKAKVKKIVAMLDEEGDMSLEKARQHLCRLYSIPAEIIPDDHQEVMEFLLMSSEARSVKLWSTLPKARIDEYYDSSFLNVKALETPFTRERVRHPVFDVIQNRESKSSRPRSLSSSQVKGHVSSVSSVAMAPMSREAALEERVFQLESFLIGDRQGDKATNPDGSVINDSELLRSVPLESELDMLQSESTEDRPTESMNDSDKTSGILSTLQNDVLISIEAEDQSLIKTREEGGLPLVDRAVVKEARAAKRDALALKELVKKEYEEILSMGNIHERKKALQAHEINVMKADAKRKEALALRKFILNDGDVTDEQTDVSNPRMRHSEAQTTRIWRLRQLQEEVRRKRNGVLEELSDEKLQSKNQEVLQKQRDGEWVALSEQIDQAAETSTASDEVRHQTTDQRLGWVQTSLEGEKMRNETMELEAESEAARKPLGTDATSTQPETDLDHNLDLADQRLLNAQLPLPPVTLKDKVFARVAALQRVAEGQISPHSHRSRESRAAGAPVEIALWRKDPKLVAQVLRTELDAVVETTGRSRSTSPVQSSTLSTTLASTWICDDVESVKPLEEITSTVESHTGEERPSSKVANSGKLSRSTSYPPFVMKQQISALKNELETTAQNVTVQECVVETPEISVFSEPERTPSMEDVRRSDAAKFAGITESNLPNAEVLLAEHDLTVLDA